MNNLRVGLVGGGIVGGGVFLLLQQMRERLTRCHGVDIEIVKICVRDLAKPRDYLQGLSEDAQLSLLTTRYEDVLEDASVDCVVEVMGGTDEARDVHWRAIAQGKHVVTANKALIAEFLDELRDLLKEHPSVQYGMEAAVCGGIPIIHSLQTDFVCDRITKLAGIMNGTTNFMLSKMEDERADYADVLREAQRLGFAEADPTADVEGHDVRAKIAILAKLAYGQTVAIEHIPTVGISSLSSVDFDCARSLQSTIKLLGTATWNSEEKSVAVYVLPTLVPLTSSLGTTKGAGNIVFVESENLHTSTFAGPGAGRFPTANSVVNDLVRIAQKKAVPPFALRETVTLNCDFEAKFYLRVMMEQSNSDELIRALNEAAEKNQMPFERVLRTPLPLGSSPYALATERVRHSRISAVADAIAERFGENIRPVFFPIL